MTCRGRAPSSHPRARVVVEGSAKQTSGRYFWRRCGRMRASPRWLEYSITYYLFRSALPHAERRVLSRSPSTPKSDVFRPALPHRERPDRQLLPFQSVCFDPRSRTGATVARESILIPMYPRSAQARRPSSRGRLERQVPRARSRLGHGKRPRDSAGPERMPSFPPER